MVEKTSLSSQTVARRVDDLANNIQNNLINRLGACQFYSLTIDESTDVCDTSQLAIFIRGVTKGFEVVEDLLDLCPMKGTTTGQDIFDEVKHIMVKFNLSEDKLCGITTDGAPAMIGNHKGFTSLMLKSISHEVITHHCISVRKNPPFSRKDRGRWKKPFFSGKNALFLTFSIEWLTHN